MICLLDQPASRFNWDEIHARFDCALAGSKRCPRQRGAFVNREFHVGRGTLCLYTECTSAFLQPNKVYLPLTLTGGYYYFFNSQINAHPRVLCCDRYRLD